MKKTIVIIGGGAGGLELVARLSRKLKSATYQIILIDNQLKHIWKPLFHEVAAGTFTSQHECIDYMSYAYELGIKFILGNLVSIDRNRKTITLAKYQNAVINVDIPERQINYDILVLAIGSQVNDFNIPGVKEHCLLLDDLNASELCYQMLLKQLVLATQDNLKKINIVIVGAGATGVELAAELNHSLGLVKKYSQKTGLNCYQYEITLIEAAPRILSMMDERISKSVNNYLITKGIKILTHTKIIAVNAQGLLTADNKLIPAQLTVWAAGVRGNTGSISSDLERNKLNQYVVTSTLQTSNDDAIFVLGDCANCPQTNRNGKIYFVPPRAQAAHQQAKLLAKSIPRYLAGNSLMDYHYKDYGSLISMNRYNVVGNLMSKVTKSLYIEGVFARFAYWLLYKKHLMILRGKRYVLTTTIADFFVKKNRPEIKLH